MYSKCKYIIVKNSHRIYFLMSATMSGTKRKRDASPSRTNGKVKKPKIKKRLSNRKKKEGKLVQVDNQFSALPSENESDSDIIFDHNKKGEDIVLKDDYDSQSDHEDDVIIESDDDVAVTSDREEIDEEVENKDEVVIGKDGQDNNELTQNNDYIGFGFESSEEERDEDAGEYSDDGVISNDEGGSVNVQTPTSLYPWIKAHNHSQQKEIADWLTMEMKDFVNYISPSKEEIMARNKVVSNLTEQIKVCWPGVEVQVFGSFATDLYLPGSDIDMVVISPTGDCENRHKLYQLSSFLRQKKIAKDIEVIAGAKVPIIKFVDPTTNIHLDISFERTNGIDAARRIRGWLNSTEGLRELVLVIKQFLRSRKLNNVHVGGLGGYSTIILCYHFLKLHPRVSTGSMNISDNLGALLIEFFELYGRNFSYDNLILAIDSKTDQPKYLKKIYHPNLNTGRNPFTIVVQDPADPDNNITRSSYNLRDIKKAFGGAYQILVDRCYQLNSASYKNRIGQLILGDIIKYRGKERDFNDDRDLVVNNALVDNSPAKRSKTKVTKKEVKAVSVDAEDDEDEVLEVGHKYFSDATIESEENETFTKTAPAPKKPKLKASDLILGKKTATDDSSDEEVQVISEKAVDKDTKRDYWRKKGWNMES